MDQEKSKLTRRGFVSATAGASAVTLLPVESEAQTETAAEITLSINGRNYRLTVEPRVTLLDALRERLQLTGSKKGCDHGQCGACTVLLNGRRVNSCLMLAMMCEGDQITTIEGLAQADTLHPMQAAFIEHDGLQCGYCTPGQICSATAAMEEMKAGHPSFVTADLKRSGPVEASDDEIRERMSGNICRCGAYPNIVTAVRAVYGAVRA